jgi:hypothetical protein
MSNKASLPADEIMADTRTFVSMTAQITYASRADHDHCGGLPAPFHDEALIVFDRAVHELAKLGAGEVGVYAAIHGFTPFMMH